ncbi:helix-turn-helix domain-containing protein [Clostridium diolis]|uniref:helix-turn-helix domain-containing protein n=1 Tax=Clostridium diolis TaxID=223919 RepID=UPI003AF6F005
MNIGEKIRKLRKDNKLTLKELGTKINLSEQAIGQYERGDRSPSLDVLNKIANIFNISLSYLLNYGDEININSNRENMYSAMMDDIQKTIDVNPDDEAIYNLKMNELYKNYFFKLFNWKTLRMDPHDFFRFILSISSLDDASHLTEEDIEELSVLFTRFLQLKNSERYCMDKVKEDFKELSQSYNTNFFLTTKHNSK